MKTATEQAEESMKLDDLYDINDNLESALRIMHVPKAITRKEALSLYALLWKAHDRLERVVISEQARQWKI